MIKLYNLFLSQGVNNGIEIIANFLFHIYVGQYIIIGHCLLLLHRSGLFYYQ